MANDSDRPTRSDHDGPQPTDESEVQRLLDEAAGLGGQVAKEIGTDAESSDGGGDEKGGGSSDVDSQLDRVEKLLRGVAAPEPDDVGAESGGDSAPETGEVADAGDEPSRGRGTEWDRGAMEDAETVSDFDVASTEVAPAAVTIRDDAIVDGDGDESVEPDEADVEEPLATDVGSAVPDGRSDGARDVAPPVAPESGGTEPGAADARDGERKRPRSGVALRLRKMRQVISGGWVPSCEVRLFGLADAVVRAFDVVDGMFAWMTLGVRQVIGWVAIALLVAATAISAYSLS